jgi:hypothetical protein
MGRRLAGSSVSGRRRPVQTSMMTPPTSSMAKTPRQLMNMVMSWPMLGAMMGMAMNTIMPSDMTLAIFRPS